MTQSKTREFVGWLYNERAPNNKQQVRIFDGRASSIDSSQRHRLPKHDGLGAQRTATLRAFWDFCSILVCCHKRICVFYWNAKLTASFFEWPRIQLSAVVRANEAA